MGRASDNDPAYSFRVWAEPKRSPLYAVVNVWPTLEAMRRHASDKKSRGKTVLGYCTPYGKGDVVAYTGSGQGTVIPRFAEVNMAFGQLTMEVVTHELFHATMAWARWTGFDLQRMNVNPVNQFEERLTRVNSNLNEQFALWYDSAEVRALENAARPPFDKGNRMAKGVSRDTTQALALAYGIRNTTSETERQQFIDHLIEILQDMDARTGRRDPSVRRNHKPAKKATVKAAAKSGTITKAKRTRGTWHPGGPGRPPESVRIARVKTAKKAAK